MDVSDRSETTRSNKRVAFTLIHFGNFHGGMWHVIQVAFRIIREGSPDA